MSFVAGGDPDYLTSSILYFIFAIIHTLCSSSQAHFLLKQDLRLLCQDSLKNGLCFLFGPCAVLVLSAACLSPLWKCQLCRGRSPGARRWEWAARWCWFLWRNAARQSVAREMMTQNNLPMRTHIRKVWQLHRASKKQTLRSSVKNKI